MGTLRLALRLLGRDFKAGQLTVLVAALVLAAASIGSVGFFADRVKGALASQANLLLGGDVLISGDRPLPAAFADEAAARGLLTTPVLRFNSMVGRSGTATETAPVLTSVKAVEERYPLRGSIQLVTTGEIDGRRAGGIPPRGVAWPDTHLAQRLHLAIGDNIAVGDATLVVGAIVQQEPEVSAGFITGSTRLLINAADIPATKLLQPGNRATWRLLVANAGAPAALEGYVGWVRAHLQPGLEMQNVRDLQPEVKQALERAEKFLGLAALVAVMLAAVAVALTASRYLRWHLDTAAMLRCLGASRGRTLAIFALQFVVLGVLASAAGTLLALVGQQLLALLLASIATAELPPPTLWPGIAAFCTGAALLLGFGLPPLVALAGVAPLRVLRRDLPRPRAWGLAAYAAGATVIATLIGWQAQDLKLAAIALGGIIGVLALSAVAAWSLIALLKRLPQRGITWRFGLANLARRPWGSSLQIGALAMGMMALLLLTVVRGDLLRTWRASLPADAPNHFVINVLPDQVEGVRATLKRVSGKDTTLYPMVRGRLTTVNGKAFDTSQFAAPQDRRLAEREFNLSSLATLPTTNRIVAGHFWSADAGPDAGLSMEEGIAKSLHLKLGDKLTFDVAGQELAGEITSLRKVDWDSFQPNFFTLFPPRALEGMPTSYLGALRVPPTDAGRAFTGELVAQFPNVLSIDIGDVLRQVQMILDQVSRAIEFVFLFTLAGGVLVLQAAIAATQDERRYDAAVLRTLGASRRQLNAAQIAEFLVQGTLAGLLAAAGATAVGYVLAARAFDIPFALDPALFVWATFGGAAAVALAGWLGTREALNLPPAAVLRQLA
jgi:putative ABC transport system permease protein